MSEVVTHARGLRDRARRCLRRAVVAVSMGATASAAGAELQVTGPDACVDGQELGFRVERALGRPVRDVAPLRVQVTISRARARLTARIEMIDEAAGARTERVVSAAECSELADAITVVIALALDSKSAPPEPALTATAPRLDSAHAASHAVRTAALAPKPAAGASGSTADPADESLVRGEGAISPAVSLWVVGDAGSLPAPGLGLSLGVELGAEHWQLRALGTLLVDQRHQLGSSGAPGAELRLATGALLGCVVPAGSFSSPLQLRACAGWELGQLSGTGSGVPQPRSGTAFWSAPLADLGVLWAVPATRLRLGALIVLVAPLGRDEFVLRDVGHVHRPASIVGRAMLGAAFALD